MRRTFFRIRELRDDGQARKRPDGVYRKEDFFNLRKGFEDVEVNAAFFERQSLLVKHV